jgi:hypothetical protein
MGNRKVMWASEGIPYRGEVVTFLPASRSGRAAERTYPTAIVIERESGEYGCLDIEWLLEFREDKWLNEEWVKDSKDDTIFKQRGG